MTNVIPIGHTFITATDRKAIFEYAKNLIIKGLVSEVATWQHDHLGTVVSFFDRKDELICNISKLYRHYEVRSGEGNLMHYAPLLSNVLSVLHTSLRHETDIPTPQHALSHDVNVRLSNDCAVAVGQGEQPGRGFLAHI